MGRVGWTSQGDGRKRKEGLPDLTDKERVVWRWRQEGLGWRLGPG